MFANCDILDSVGSEFRIVHCTECPFYRVSRYCGFRGIPRGLGFLSNKLTVLQDSTKTTAVGRERKQLKMCVYNVLTR